MNCNENINFLISSNENKKQDKLNIPKNICPSNKFTFNFLQNISKIKKKKNNKTTSKLERGMDSQFISKDKHRNKYTEKVEYIKNKDIAMFDKYNYSFW